MRWFTEHPASVGETYFQHFNYALSVGIVLFGLVIILIIHAFFPFLFKNTVSEWLSIIVDLMKARQNDVDKQN